MKSIFTVILLSVFYKMEITIYRLPVKDRYITLINKYQEFCQMISLKQLITCLTRVTCNTLSLIDHILTNCSKKILAVVLAVVCRITN